MKQVLLIFSYLILQTVGLFAQMPTFNPREKAQLERQIRGNVDRFCNTLSDLASSETDKDAKKACKSYIKTLFIDSAMVTTMSFAHPNENPMLLPKYLDVVGAYKDRFKYVALEFYKVMVNIHGLQETTVEGRPAYKGTFSFWQKFTVADKKLISLKDEEFPILDQINYNISDSTRKTGVFYIIRNKETLQGPPYKILLGNIHAREIVPLKK